MKTSHILLSVALSSLLLGCQIEVTPLEQGAAAGEAATDNASSEQPNNDNTVEETTSGDEDTHDNAQGSGSNQNDNSGNGSNEQNGPVTNPATGNDDAEEPEAAPQPAPEETETNAPAEDETAVEEPVVNEPVAEETETIDPDDTAANNGNDTVQPEPGDDTPIDETPITEEPVVAPSLAIQWLIPVERENNEQLYIYEIGGYDIEYRKVGDTEFKSIRIEDGSAESYVFENIEAGEYEIRIAAFDVNGLYSRYSDSTTLTAS